MLNQRLLNLYEKHWDNLISSLTGNDLTNPLLLHIRDEQKYENADIKVMIFGQETNDWEGSLGSKNIEELTELYSQFLESKHRGHFWNGVRDYVNTIKQMNSNKSVEYVWNNVIKIGKVSDKGIPIKSLINIQKELFPVIRKEIEILNPNFIIFFTGPHYDQYIEHEWKGLVVNEIGNWNKQLLSTVSHQSLPSHTYRTNHPQNLYFKGRQIFSDIKNTIVSGSISL